MIVQDSAEHIAWRETFWQGRERVFLERFEAELALARAAYRRGMADADHAEEMMREAQERGVWLWECRLAIWLGGLLRTVYEKERV